MKITYLHQYFVTTNMPGCTRSYEMARRLVAMGHEVNMVTSWRESDDRSNWFETEETGIKVHWLPLPYSNRMNYRDRIKAFFIFAWKAANKAASLGADVIFATSTPLTIALPAVYAKRKLKIPMVFEVRDLWPELPIAIGAIKNPLAKKLAIKLESWAYDHSSAIVALSPGMKDGISKTGVKPSRVAVIPNASDIEAFSSAHSGMHQESSSTKPWLSHHPLLIYTGTLGKINGVSYAVDLAVALRQRGSEVRILLVGDGAEREQIEQRANRQGVLGHNFFMENKMLKRDMPALYASADMTAAFFIDLPEMRANSANKFFDALASGKPVLLNYGGWMHDLVEKHACGLAMWEKPLDHVAAELDRVMHDPVWLADAGRNARGLAERYFDRDKLATQLERLLVAVKEGRGHEAESIAPGVYD